ncbi:hypothetical protein AGR6A_pTi0051 [Agrobacterium sp. NCPPB 925]|nr:hypothetical protein AGR6A_pTi0051 [Agrobacterium sp. NCPPB 925]
MPRDVQARPGAKRRRVQSGGGRIYSIVNGFMFGKSIWISNEYDVQSREKETVFTSLYSSQKCIYTKLYYKIKSTFLIRRQLQSIILIDESNKQIMLIRISLFRRVYIDVQMGAEMRNFTINALISPFPDSHFIFRSV